MKHSHPKVFYTPVRIVEEHLPITVGVLGLSEDSIVRFELTDDGRGYSMLQSDGADGWFFLVDVVVPGWVAEPIYRATVDALMELWSRVRAQERILALAEKIIKGEQQ